MRRGRLLCVAALAFALAGVSGALAYWSAPGTGVGSAAAASLEAAAISVPASATNTVTVTWSAQASLVPAAPGNSQITYTVERRLDDGAYAAVSSGGCAGSKPVDTTSCVNSPSSPGSYSYRVVASIGSWTATSADTSAVALSVTGPIVESITPLDPDPSSAETLRWEVTFTQAVSGIDTADFALSRGGTLSGGSVSTVTGSGASYTVSASTGTGSGALGLNLVDDDSILDGLSNPLGGVGSGNGDFSGQTYTIDHTAPAVSSIVRASTNPTNAASARWTVTFDEPVSAVDGADFALVRGGSLVGGTITAVTGSATTYTVTASTGTGSGTLRLDLADDDTIVDAPSNPLGGAGVGNGDFSGQAYTVDRTAPTLSSIVTAEATPTNGATVSWTVTFSEAVGGVDDTDFALARTGTVSASAAIQSVTGSGGTRTVTATTVSGEGTLGLNLAGNGTVVDDVGNALAGDATGQTYTIDRTAPASTALEMLDTNANGRIDQVKVTFGETLVSSTATAPWTLANVPSAGALASVSTSGAIATLTIDEGAGAAATAVGSFTVALAAAATGVRDSAGNEASFAATAPADKAAPVPVSVSDTNGTIDGRIETGDSFTATFSEAIAPASLPASTPIIENGASPGLDTLTINGFTFGPLGLGAANYVFQANIVEFAGTSVLSGGGTTITITAGACTSACGQERTGNGTSMIFIPATTLHDADGNAAAGSRSTGFRIF